MLMVLDPSPAICCRDRSGAPREGITSGAGLSGAGCFAFVWSLVPVSDGVAVPWGFPSGIADSGVGSRSWGPVAISVFSEVFCFP